MLKLMIVAISLASSFTALGSTVGIRFKFTNYLRLIALMIFLLKFIFIIFLAVMLFRIVMEGYKHNGGLPILNIISVAYMSVQWDDNLEEERWKHVTATKAGIEEN